jgi:hypothetical protein
MPADNPSHILRLLDARLDHSVELTLIGKSALWLGFDGAPAHFGSTLDVDGVVPTSQSAAFDADMGFWDALRNANQELAALGLYLTHIFEESQIILTSNWMENRTKVLRPPLQNLVVYRPSAVDLILTKMMRGGDPQDLEEICWLAHHEGITVDVLKDAFGRAVVPNDAEILELFERAKPLVLAKLSS